MITKKDILIQRAVKEIMQNKNLWSDVIVLALETHLTETFTDEEIKDTFFEDYKGGL